MSAGHMQPQQAFLHAAKTTLGLTWDELAVRSGIHPRALKNYRLPATSQNFRTLAGLARRAVQQLLDAHMTETALSAGTTGFFVDWNGDTRRVDRPGFGYTCGPIRNEEVDGRPYQAVDVIDSQGFVTHEAVYYPTLEALAAVGVTINLVE